MVEVYFRIKMQGKCSFLDFPHERGKVNEELKYNFIMEDLMLLKNIKRQAITDLLVSVLRLKY